MCVYVYVHGLIRNLAPGLFQKRSHCAKGVNMFSTRDEPQSDKCSDIFFPPLTKIQLTSSEVSFFTCFICVNYHISYETSRKTGLLQVKQFPYSCWELLMIVFNPHLYKRQETYNKYIGKHSGKYWNFTLK